MSTSKHFDKICAAVLAAVLIITVLFMNGEALGIKAADNSMGYEDKLFDTAKVHTVDIVMDDWDSFIEGCESEEYSVCTVVIDGEKYSDIGIRAKGNTSLSSVKSLGSERYSFKLEFDQYESGKSYHGLDKLCLNNLIQDNTMMKDYIVYQMMQDFGVDSPLCSFTYITVNGEDWGLYLAVEGIEDSFLERNYGSEQGELYKPDSLSFGGGRGNGRDFNMDDFDFTGSEDSTATDGDTSTTVPEGFDGGEMPAMPEDDSGSAMPEMGQNGGGMPNNMGGFGGGDMSELPEDFDMSQLPDDFDVSQLPDDFDASETPTMPEDGSSGEMPDMQGGQNAGNMDGGMGSDDVKLKYVDDDPDSYSNIFNNAKTAVKDSDKTRLINSLKNLSEYSDLENTLDIDEVLRYFVVHNFVCNGDSYTGSMVHNYYLYEEDGLLSMIPWDYNLAFGTFQGGNASSTVNTSIDSPVSGGSVDDRPMVGWIFSDEEYTEQYHELFAEFIEKWFTNGELEALISETAELIRPYVEKDPTKFCTTEEFDSGVSALTEFVALRGEAVSNQLAGDNTAVDTGDLNLSDMGSMGNTNGGGDMGGGNMPENAGDTAQQPQTDDGTENGEQGEMPTMPAEGDMQMPTGMGGEGQMTPPDMSEGGNGQMPQGNGGGMQPQQSEGTDNAEQSTQPTMPAESTQPQGNENREQPAGEQNAPTEAVSSPTQFIVLGASLLVLIIGLVIAIKYKR